MKDKIKNIIKARAAQKQELAKESENIARAVDLIIQCYKSGNKLLIAGNGGSAADSQHIAGELVGRFLKNRKALSAIALSTDTSVLTAISNDFSYEDVFSRQVEGIAVKGDVLLLISTSGNSPNLVRAMEAGIKAGCSIITLTQDKDNAMASMGHVNIRVPHGKSPEIQENHATVYHIICELVESGLF
jgi:D-sedoheptulose 7-phosphate isomerase